MFAVCAGIFSVSALGAGYNLTIAPVAENKVTLSWPVTATNYVLQSTISLASPNWLTVTNPAPVAANNVNSVTYTDDSMTRYFRLYLLNTVSGVFLSISKSGANFVLSWPVAATNYVLQSSTSLVSPNWQTVVNPAPVAVNNTNFVTYTNISASSFFRLYLNTNNAPSAYPGMVLIPAGAFTMGDVTDTNVSGDAAPVTATVSAFYMDTNLVSYALWQSVYNWATGVGYNFVDSGAGKAANHPVQTVNWYDAVKWCNARSQRAGLTPVYYTDAGFTQAYTNGQTDTVYANWSVSGYRLPTEAEWEKAARGGLSSQRFPWGNTISESRANYYGDPLGAPSSGPEGGPYFYDLGPFSYNASYAVVPMPYTSPVGAFAPNGYGLFDMAGNVMQWCWDWYGTPYPGGTDPRGAASGFIRVLRGGSWQDDASLARCASRGPTYFFPGNDFNSVGFRCVRGH